MGKYEFYEIFRDPNVGGYGKTPGYDFDRYCEVYLRFVGKPIINWQPLHFNILDNIGEGKGFIDYQFASFADRLCSQRLKDLFDSNKSPEDKIQWLDVTATWNGETRPYYILHFYEDTDVLDPVLSRWNPERKHYDELNKVYVREKIGNHNIFSYPMDYIGLTVRAFIIKEIKKLKITGMTWEPALVR